MRGCSFLEPQAGTYQMGGYKLVITPRSDNVLTFATPTCASYDRDSVRAPTFAIKGVIGGTIDFKKDAEGAVTEFAITTPGSTSVAKRTRHSGIAVVVRAAASISQRADRGRRPRCRYASPTMRSRAIGRRP